VEFRGASRPDDPGAALGGKPYGEERQCAYANKCAEGDDKGDDCSQPTDDRMGVAYFQGDHRSCPGNHAERAPGDIEDKLDVVIVPAPDCFFEVFSGHRGEETRKAQGVEGDDEENSKGDGHGSASQVAGVRAPTRMARAVSIGCLYRSGAAEGVAEVSPWVPEPGSFPPLS
jgi:hypothetical protein